MKVRLKDVGRAAEFNALLLTRGVEGSFFREEEWMEWVDEINSDPDHVLNHLKPVDVMKLKTVFRSFVTGEVDWDLYFGRTPVEQMQGIGLFIRDHHADIEWISGSDTLIERGELDPSVLPILRVLEKVADPPALLPEEDRRIPEHEGGHLLCKTWSGPGQEFWVIFGAVDELKFLRRIEYVDDHMNSLYRDSQGRGYLMLPLYNFSRGFMERVYDAAYQMGLREDPNYLGAMVYKFELDNVVQVSESFKESYSCEELEARFIATVQAIRSFEKNHAFTFDGKQIKLDSIRMSGFLSCYLQVLNALSMAMKVSHGKLSRAQSDWDSKIDTFVFQFKNVEL